MSESAKVLAGICPLCAGPISDGMEIGGIWTGSIKSKASNGSVYSATCKKCGEDLIAMPTHEEVEAGRFFWELGTEFPGERFVATMTGDGNMRDFLAHIDSFVGHLKASGFEARCPAYTFAGILVPKAQAVAAREFLKTQRIDYMRVWITDDDGRPQAFIGP